MRDDKGLSQRSDERLRRRLHMSSCSKRILLLSIDKEELGEHQGVTLGEVSPTLKSNFDDGKEKIERQCIKS